jgi:hypothetical protein
MQTVTELIRAAQTLKEKAEQASEKSDQFYVALGKKLAELKERKPNGTTWPDFVKKHFGYSRERADELIRVATGATSITKLREGKKASMKKSRAKPAPRGAGSKQKDNDNVLPFSKKSPEEGDCNYDDGDPDHVKGDTKEQIRRQIFLNMAREWGIKRPTEVLDDAFFSKASPEEVTDDLFVEIEAVIAAWNVIAVKLTKLKGAKNVKIKA